MLLIGSLSITACGQKGPLYKSSPAEVNQSKKDTPAKRDGMPAQTAEPQAETDKTQ